jgi:hypothetical protein
MIRDELILSISLYGWLISTEDADVISKSHNMLSPFDEYIHDKNDKEQSRIVSCQRLAFSFVLNIW